MNADFKRLTFIECFWSFFNGLIAPFLVIYFNDFGGLDEVGISVAIMYLIQGIVPFIIIKLFKKKKRNMKKLFLLGQSLESLRVLFFIFAKSITHIYIIQLIGGITSSLVMPSYSKIFVNVGDDENDDAFNKQVGFINLSLGISALISGFFINYFGFIPVFILWSATEFIYGIYVYYLV